MSFSFSEHLKRLYPWKAQILRPQATPKTTNKKHTKRVGERSRRRVVAGSGKGGASHWPQTQPPKSAGNLAWSWSLWLFRVASIPQGSRVNTLGWLSSMLVLSSEYIGIESCSERVSCRKPRGRCLPTATLWSGLSPGSTCICSVMSAQERSLTQVGSLGVNSDELTCLTEDIQPERQAQPLQHFVLPHNPVLSPKWAEVGGKARGSLKRSGYRTGKYESCSSGTRRSTSGGRNGRGCNATG